jgi:hypothetical protein
MNIFITEVCHQRDTEILTMAGTFLLVYEMYHQNINSKIFVSVNPAIVYQIQLRLALADSLLERITKVIQTWL